MEASDQIESKDIVNQEGQRKHFKQFKNYSSSKKADYQMTLNAFNLACNRIAPSVTTEIKDYESDIVSVMQAFIDASNIDTQIHLLLAKTTMQLVKAMKKKEGKSPSKDILVQLNKWQSNFWNTTMSSSKLREILTELQRSCAPFYYVKTKGDNLEFGNKEDEDQDKQFSENIDMLLESKSNQQTSDYEIWSINHTLKSLSMTNKDKEENYGQKMALALKRNPAALHQIVNVKHSKTTHSSETMMSSIRNIFEGNSPPSSGYSFEVKRDIEKLLTIFSSNFDKNESIKEVVDFLMKLENVVVTALITPHIKRNFIGFAY